jgi:hypothetical protein
LTHPAIKLNYTHADTSAATERTVSNKNKWNYGFTFEHSFDLPVSISTNKRFEELTAEELLTAIELRLNSLKSSGNEVLEMVWLNETVEYND